MKKAMNFFSAACAIAIASAVAACSSDALVNEEAPAKEQQKVSLTVKATQGSRTPDTRLVYTPSGDGKTMNVEWSPSETLGVVTYDGSNLEDKEYLTSTNTEAAASATFTGTASESTDNKYNFYYPMNATTISDNTMTMNVEGQLYTLDNSLLPLYNLMYTKQAVDPSTETVQLYHAFALIRFVLTLPAEAGDIDNIALSTWEPVFPTTAKLTYDAEGGAALTYEGSTDILFLQFTSDDGSGVTNGDGSRTINAYMMVPEVKDFTGQLCKVTVTDEDDNCFSYVYNLTGNKDNTAAVGNITPQKLYTFTATLKEDRWAGSSIYWDEANQKFAFDPTYKISAAQGLYFKWGSLMGRAATANGAFVANSTPVYTLEGATTKSAWEDLTYDDTTASGELNSANDICTQVGGADWRMPRQTEFTTNTESIVSLNSGMPEGYKADGTTAIKKGNLYDGLFYIPFGGLASYTGTITSLGDNVSYWSSTASSATSAYRWSISYGLSIVSIRRDSAFPIRCIKKTAEELAAE
jgi:uncharacterized protein (TIGR02145 family)